MAANSVLEDAKQHGLGLGLDITNDDPWRNRSSFNARRNATPDDILEVREEGVAEYLKVSNVEDKSFIFEANASLGALHQAKSVVMKVGFSREVYNSQKLEVTTVRTRTVSFEVNPGDKRETSFERELCDKINFEDDQSMETLLKACAGFVDTYKITHYTAAITLGAMEYTVHNKQATQSSSKLSAGAGDHVSATASAENNKRAEGTYTSTAGTLADKSVKKEAVILIEMKPIHTLVRKPNLARALENAIAIYCLEKMPQPDRPFIVKCRSSHDPVFWKVNDETGTIEGTTDDKSATLFCIERACNKLAIKKFDKGNVATYVNSGVHFEWLLRLVFNMCSKQVDDIPLSISANNINTRNTSFFLLNQKQERVNPDYWIKDVKWCFIECEKGKLCMKKSEENVYLLYVVSPSTAIYNDKDVFMLFELIPQQAPSLM